MNKITETVTNVDVDAGMIIVCDIDYWAGIQGFDIKELRKSAKFFKVPNGMYKVTADVYCDIGDMDVSEEEENRTVCSSDFELQVTSGYISVIDPCYAIREEIAKDSWDKWLRDTDHGDGILSDSAYVISSMGGDGTYKIVFEFIKE